MLGWVWIVGYYGDDGDGDAGRDVHGRGDGERDRRNA